jgi:hypothetical protein
LRESDYWYGQVCILVTGRLPTHEQLTLDWFGAYCATYEDAPAEVSYVSVPWDDSCATREESYKKYVRQKYMKLLDIALAWCKTFNESGIEGECHVYEDDVNVLAALADKQIGLDLHVVKDGEVHDYP